MIACRTNPFENENIPMKLFFITLVVFGIFILAMAVGVIFGKRRIRGSCGGVGGEGCDICGAEREKDEVSPSQCRESKEAVAVSDGG